MRGWEYGEGDNEGAAILASFGQSDDGQEWKFLLNADGSYRMVSRLSGDTKAITALQTPTSGVYSYTYNQSNLSRYASWELIRVNPSESTYVYNKIGRNVEIELDTNTYLQGKITPENLTRWITQLDDAYDKYVELVGKKPYNLKYPEMGNKIIIKPGEGEDGGAWVLTGDNAINWNKDNIADALRIINRDGDVTFGMLYEMGHVFDFDDRWSFDVELLANFKMAYVLKRLESEGNLRIYMGNKWITQYSDVIKLYEKDYNAYLKNLVDYTNDGLTYMLLGSIESFGDWSYVKETPFRTAAMKEDIDVGTQEVLKKTGDDGVTNWDLIEPVTHQKTVPDGYVDIFTARDLDHVRNDLSGNYILMDDIDLSDWGNWEPIGADRSLAFTGIFDGNGYVIKKMTIVIERMEPEDSYESVHMGLFGMIHNRWLQARHDFPINDVINLTIQFHMLGYSPKMAFLPVKKESTGK